MNRAPFIAGHIRWRSYSFDPESGRLIAKDFASGSFWGIGYGEQMRREVDTLAPSALLGRRATSR